MASLCVQTMCSCVCIIYIFACMVTRTTPLDSRNIISYLYCLCTWVTPFSAYILPPLPPSPPPLHTHTHTRNPLPSPSSEKNIFARLWKHVLKFLNSQTKIGFHIGSTISPHPSLSLSLFFTAASYIHMCSCHMALGSIFLLHVQPSWSGNCDVVRKLSP